MATSQDNVGNWVGRISFAPTTFYFMFAAASPANPAQMDIAQVWILGPRSAAWMVCVATSLISAPASESVRCTYVQDQKSANYAFCPPALNSTLGS